MKKDDFLRGFASARPSRNEKSFNAISRVIT